MVGCRRVVVGTAHCLKGGLLPAVHYTPVTRGLLGGTCRFRSVALELQQLWVTTIVQMQCQQHLPQCGQRSCWHPHSARLRTHPQHS